MPADSLTAIAQRDSGNRKEVKFVYYNAPQNLTAASTDAVYSRDIVKYPVTNIKNALVGRLSGLYALQFSGEPGSDGVNITLRGQGPLTLVDGIPRELTTLDLEEIESVTVLKDALSTAVLGVRGARGALLITTKKGSAAKQQISFTVQNAFQQPLNLPKVLNSYEYARLYNEASINDGLAPAYTDADLQGYLTGADPVKYPNVDWRKTILKNSARFTRYTLSATGGNIFARYFVSIDHANQSGLFVTDDKNKYNTNNTFKSYILRSNVDLTINSKLNAGIYILGRILNGNEPGSTATGTNPSTSGTSTIFNALLNTPNNAYPIFTANNTYGGSQQFQNNIWAQTTGSGYRQNYRRDMLVDVYLQRKVDEIAEGMFVKGTASYYATLSENIDRSKSFAVYGPSTTGINQQFGLNGDQLNGNAIESQSRTDYLELKIGYDHVFNGRHGINAFVLANRNNSASGSDLPYTISGGAGRVGYNFKERYVAEFSFGWNGSNRYATNGATKHGFFPAAGLAWNVAKETFMRKYSWIDNLKLFGSYGKTGWDNPGYFVYIQRYFDAATAYFGTGAGGNTSIAEQTIANENITWEKANKLNVGVQGAVLKDKLSFSAEYYALSFSDLLMQRGRNTTLFGNTFPNENIGRKRYAGWEYKIGWQQSRKNFSYFIDANAASQNSEVLFIDEVFRRYDWMKRTGRMDNQRFGYIAEGLFQSQSEINGAATIQGYTPQPGDIKYKDLNSDGIIDQFDEAPIGREKPLFIYGVNLGFSFKGFDISALLQGVGNRDIYLSGNSYWAFQNGGFGQAYQYNLDRWTPSTASTASFPRVNIGTNTNNQSTSSYWLRSGDYTRVKNVELGYTLTSSMMQRIKLQSARLFVNGTNLLTFTSLKDMDPEVFNGGYPIQRVINVGMNIKF